MVFHAVMEEGSVSKAAGRMRLSQPAVSLALSTLEDTLGYPLFHRSKGHFAPKPEALQLHEDAELAILAFENFASRAQLVGKGDTGLVRLGSIGAPAFHFLPRTISTFATEHENAEVRLLVRSSTRITYLVGNGQTDIGFVEAPVTAPSVKVTRISLPCVCILRKDDPLADKSVLAPEHLADRRIISVYDDHLVDRQLRTAFTDANVPWAPRFRCYFFAIMRNMVANGAGIAVVDAVNGCAELNDGVVWRRFEPEIRFDLAVITRANTTLRTPAAEFMDMAIDGLRRYRKLISATG